MSKKAAEHHKKASEHLTHAARHHGEAAKHHEAGNHEKAAHHAHTARAHVIHGRGHAEEAVKDIQKPIAHRGFAVREMILSVAARGSARALGRILAKYATYYNQIRTHVSLGKDALCVLKTSSVLIE